MSGKKSIFVAHPCLGLVLLDLVLLDLVLLDLALLDLALLDPVPEQAIL